MSEVKEIKFTLQDDDFNSKHIRPGACLSCIFGHRINQLKLPFEQASVASHEHVYIGDKNNEDGGEIWTIHPTGKAESLIDELDKFTMTWFNNNEAWPPVKWEDRRPTGAFIEHLEKMRAKYSGKNFKIKYRKKAKDEDIL